MDRGNHQRDDDDGPKLRKLNIYIDLHDTQAGNKILIAQGYHRTDARTIIKPYL